jgi:hypothetical protein
MHPSKWRVLALLLCALFLASIARYYHPGFGFTALLGLPKGHDYELPELQALPQVDYEGTGYDAQYYVQLALRPSLRDPAIDRAMDVPPYRARRILFSWTAYALGLGRPRLIVQVYALQNVACWLVLAWLITRWIPPETPRLFALWAAAMFSHGLLFSVRFALLDGPSLLLIVIAAVAMERGSRFTSAVIVGVGGLARETNLLAAIALVRRPHGWREWIESAGLAVLVVLPLFVWQDYLYSIYRSASRAGGNQLAAPFTAFAGSWRSAISGIAAQGVVSPALHGLLIAISLTVQAAFLAWTRTWRDPWWRIAAAFAALMMIVSPAVWVGYPGAITRVVLPLTFGFNILLSRERRGFWVWWALGNLHVLPALHALPILGIVPPI